MKFPKFEFIEEPKNDGVVRFKADEVLSVPVLDIDVGGSTVCTRSSHELEGKAIFVSANLVPHIVRDHSDATCIIFTRK